MQHESPYRVHLRPIPQIYEFDHGIDAVRHRPDHEAWLTRNHLDLPPTPWPFSSDVVVHMGSAKGACSLGPGSARAPSYRVHLRPIPQIYEFDHGTPHRFLLRQCMCAASLSRDSSRTAKFDLLYTDPTPVSAQLVMFTEAWTAAANPFLCGVKGNTVVGMCSPA